MSQNEIKKNWHIRIFRYKIGVRGRGPLVNFRVGLADCIERNAHK